MATTFVVRNQLGQYLTRKNEWVSGKDPAELFHQPHYDQALNQLIELNAKDIELRGKVCEVGLSDKGRPVIEELGPDPQQPELHLDETDADISDPADSDKEVA